MGISGARISVFSAQFLRRQKQLPQKTVQKVHAAVCEKNTPPENYDLGKIILQNAKSGAGELFLPPDCRARAHLKGMFASQTPVAGGWG